MQHTYQKHKSYQWANWSLVVMGAGFLLTLRLPEPFSLLHAGFEAGLVGGLADWFAVTALFRHPMGIPIPHTALLPKNRIRMIEAVVHTLENDWLSLPSLQERWSRVRVLDYVLPNLKARLDEPKTHEMILKSWQYLLKTIKKNGYVQQLQQTLHTQILSYWQNDGGQLLDAIAKYAENELERPERIKLLGSLTWRALERMDLPVLIRPAIYLLSEERLGNIVADFLRQVAKELQDPLNSNRQAIDGHITAYLEGDAWQEKQVEWLDMVYNKALNIELSDVSEIWVPKIKQALNLSSEVRENIETYIHEQVMVYIAKNHHYLGGMVRENLEKLDDKALVALAEDKLGPDLQWVRINGALCGFLIGLLLGGIQILLK